MAQAKQAIERFAFFSKKEKKAIERLPAGGGFSRLGSPLGDTGRTTARIVSSMLKPGAVGASTAGGSPPGAAGGGVAATAALMTGAILLLLLWLPVLY